MEDHSDSPWYRQAKAHWKQCRPKLYAALEKNDQLHKRLNKAVDQTKDEYYRAIENGMEPHEAWEATRENHLFLPSEEDQPVLGEDPNPRSDPSALASTTRSRLKMRSGPVAPSQSMLATSRQSIPEKLKEMAADVDEKHKRPALQNLLEKVVEFGQKRAEEISDKPEPQSKTQYADPELVKEALARAKRLLALASEKLKEMPTPSKRIH
jgi:hypothetical protein